MRWFAILSLLTLWSGSAQASSCAVTSARQIATGGNQSWGKVIAFDDRDSRGIRQVFTIRADGTHKTCFSCHFKPMRNKVEPLWIGDRLIVSVEDDWHPLVGWNTSPWVQELIINGMATELYSRSPQGRWTQLTNYQKTSTGLGVMAAATNGHTLIWSVLVKAAGTPNPWGTYRLMSGSFSGGVLRWVHDITPKNALPFVEAGSVSPDGKTVLYSGNSSAARNWDMDIYSLKNGVATRLTTDPGWDEHPVFTPDGKQIIYMAAQFHDDLTIMNLDGSNKQRLTRFNTPGQPGYTDGYSMVMTPSWSRDGKSLAATQQSIVKYPAIRQLWIVKFSGSCGGT